MNPRDEDSGAENASAADRLRRLIVPDTRTEEEVLRDKLRLALDLHRSGVGMKRKCLEREFPDATPEEIDERLSSWMLSRPHDRIGVPVSWPRTRRGDA